VTSESLADDSESDLLVFGDDAAKAALDDVDALEAGPVATAVVAGGADGERSAVDATDGAATPVTGDNGDVVVR